MVNKRAGIQAHDPELNQAMLSSLMPLSSYCSFNFYGKQRVKCDETFYTDSIEDESSDYFFCFYAFPRPHAPITAWVLFTDLVTSYTNDPNS